jgi:hypothetical protein
VAKRGRPSGTTKAFSSDPDRYIIAMIDALLGCSRTTFEHAAMFAIYFHRQERITLPTDPLQEKRRLGLTPGVLERLQRGWQLQQWGPRETPNRDIIGGQVDRIRKKIARIVDDPTAARWRYYMGLAWASLLRAPNLRVIEAAIHEAGEGVYFQTVMLPLASAI